MPIIINFSTNVSTKIYFSFKTLSKGGTNMAASAVEKIELDVPIKATPQQFYEVLCNKTYHISNVCPDIVKGVDLHEGDWGTEGSIISWNYVFSKSFQLKYLFTTCICYS
jgi:hypothetical protein